MAAPITDEKVIKIQDTSGSLGKDKLKKSKKSKKDGGEKKPVLTPAAKGHLRDWSTPMADFYKPSHIEPGYDEWWNACELFKADNKDTKSSFVMVMPPPNVTGTLHLGHALTCSIEDAIARWRRMSGHNVLWLPGCDHAGIATQVVVEKKLMREQKKDRHDLGRDAFLKEVWKWKQSNGSRIYDQIRCLGASVDWSRESFTMDDKLSAAVKEAFIRLHKSGLIYRASRLVSWSCHLRTAISNIEVDKIEIKEPTFRKVPGHTKEVEFGVIHKFAYKVAGSSTEQIIVATTRLETMLGDVAVAVHPADPRYKHLIGKKLVHPLLPNRDMTVIGDGVLVDPKFGTGAVKITPAHDPNDYKCGTDNKLPFINILNDDGTLNDECGSFAGMKRFEARELLVAELTKIGQFYGKEVNPMTISVCSRSGDIIEPVIRPQWWVKCKGMADKALKVVETGELDIIPETFKGTWNRWLGDIQDWCISRQLWWGHRIPAYHVTFDGKSASSSSDMDDRYWIVANSEDEAKTVAMDRFKSECKDLSTIKLKQDEDVLDTWFSSGLFPFSSLGWPNETQDMKAFYSGTLLETGHDIVFFWVARMVMMGLQLTGKLPFTKVLLHAMVRDKLGRKMSKSLGNIIDPLDVRDGVSLEVMIQKLRTSNLNEKEMAKSIDRLKLDFPNGIEECGADALRFGLLSYSSPMTHNINLDVARVVSYRHFGNKIWNATKFALLHFPKDYVPPSDPAAVNNTNSLPDKWILHRLALAVANANKHFEQYDFAALCDDVHAFWYNDLCDNYLELLKPTMMSDQTKTENVEKKNASLAVLYTCLQTGLRLMHPTMPFLSEELYHRLPGANLNTKPTTDRKLCGSISVAPYPKSAEYNTFLNAEADATMILLQNVAKTTRSLIAGLGLSKSKKVAVFLLASDAKEKAIVTRYAAETATLSGASKMVCVDDGISLPRDCIMGMVKANLVIHLPIAGLVDMKAELEKYDRNFKSLRNELNGLVCLTSGSAFEGKTKPDVKEKMLGKLSMARKELAELTVSMEEFKKIVPADIQKHHYTDRIAKIELEIKSAQESLVAFQATVPAQGKEVPKKLQKAIEVGQKKVTILEDDLAAAKNNLNSVESAKSQN